jgi:UDPglucose 6-dehydrogenase
LNLGVIGGGYVGLTTAVCLADLSHKICLYDLNQQKIDEINQKKSPFFEKDLDDFLARCISKKTLTTTSSLKSMIETTDGCFVCVGTPSKKDGSIDLEQIKASIQNIAETLKELKKENYVIILRSTVLPGTARNVVYPILKEKVSKFGLCSIPEFLQEGQAIADFMNADKIVIGHVDENSLKFAEDIFSYFLDKVSVFRVNLETAELIKYTNNAFFSTLISFSNEISNIAETLPNVDVYQIMNALTKDKRITIKKGNDELVPQLVSYLWPGCGFGGSCLPKDMKALTAFAKSNNTQTPLLDAVLRINEKRARDIVTKAETIEGSLEGKRISVLGLAFKPHTDDIRESPSIEAIKILNQKGANLIAYDPLVKKELLDKVGIDIEIASTLEECLNGSDIAMLFTKWPEFKKINSKMLKEQMKKPLIIDGRGHLQETEFEKDIYFKMGSMI